MKELITDIFGVYTPTTYTNYVCTDVTNGTYEAIDVIPSGLAGVDWVWIGGLALFLLITYCMFRIIGRSSK